MYFFIQIHNSLNDFDQIVLLHHNQSTTDNQYLNCEYIVVSFLEFLGALQ